MTPTTNDIEKIAADVSREDYAALNRLFRQDGAAKPEIIWHPSENDLEIPVHIEMLRYWQRIGGNGAIPTADRIDPLDMKFALGYLMLIDVLDGGGDFSYRLYGSSIALHYGHDMTGRRASEFPDRIGAFFRAVYRASMIRRSTVYTAHEPPRQVFVKLWRRLVLPLAGANGDVIRFLVCNIPEDRTRGVGIPKTGKRGL